MKKLSLLLLAGLSLASLSCRRTAALGPYSLAPSYYAVAEAAPAVPKCAQVSGFTISDSRATPLVVGHRFSEDNPTEKFEISSESDPAAWIQAGANEAFRRAGLNTTAAGQGALSVSVAMVELEEKTAWNSEFDAKLVLDVTVSKPGSSDACWTGRVEGFAENYGEAGSNANYVETLNHALDRALNTLLIDKGFLDGACGTCNAAPATGL